MIPLRSSERTYSTPTVTLVIIAINVLVFIYELSLSGWRLNYFIATHGIVPDHLNIWSLVTSMFIHGGFLHILGNMWFLWVFGRGIEDILGHMKFLIFYLACGLAAALIHVLVNPSSPVPTVGASGAIAGVMGAYLIKFPRARIVTLIPIIIFITTVDIPGCILTSILVCDSIFQRRRLRRLFAGVERRRCLVRAHRRISGRHGLDHADAHSPALSAISTMAIICFRK